MHEETAQTKVHGITAEFNDPDELVAAAKKAYAAGYRKMEGYSPFPVHGLAEAIGFHKTGVPPLVLAGGLTGATAGFAFQYWCSNIAYAVNVGGKPMVSWPAWIPITFELGILFAAFASAFGMLALNGFPRPYHPIFNAVNFERATRDGFFICIESDDEKFDETATTEFLESLNPVHVALVNE
ncbi:MAG: DUF3341 domain-containing protein [Candidatus Hydrogenedentes bacterium]|nr:DUF3341 domain-containing protein [Candidatus Hydrogenedentota bacterium]